MYNQEEEYLELLHHVLTEGFKKGDRTGTGTLNYFGPQLHFDVSEDFLLMTTKKVWFKGIFEELRWFLSGSTNVNDLDPAVQHLWSPWAKEDGSLGRSYGEQWRRAKYVDKHGEVAFYDKIETLINKIKNNPDSRRIVANTWNSAEEELTELPWCHGSVIQFYVQDGKLSMKTYQRSCDIMLGNPYNLASYNLLLRIFANICGLEADQMIYTLGDTHLYLNHTEQAKTQLEREPFPLPKLNIKRKLELEDLWNLDINDFEVIGYQHHPAIQAPLAI